MVTTVPETNLRILREIEETLKADLERAAESRAKNQQVLQALAEERSGYDDLVVARETRARILEKDRRDIEFQRSSRFLIKEVQKLREQVEKGEACQPSLHCQDWGHVIDPMMVMVKLREHSLWFCPHCVARAIARKNWRTSIYAA